MMKRCCSGILFWRRKNKTGVRFNKDKRANDRASGDSIFKFSLKNVVHPFTNSLDGNILKMNKTKTVTVPAGKAVILESCTL